MSSEKKLIVLIVFIIVVFAAVGGFFLWKNQSLQEKTESQNPPLKTIQWKEFVHESYKYALKYPSEWHVYSHQTGNAEVSGVTITPYSLEEIKKDRTLPQLNVIYLYPPIKEPLKDFIQQWKEKLNRMTQAYKELSPELETKTSEINIDGYPTIKITRYNMSPRAMGILEKGVGQTAVGIEYYLFKYPDRFLIICRYPITEKGYYQKLFDEIINSFHFVKNQNNK